MKNSTLEARKSNASLSSADANEAASYRVHETRRLRRILAEFKSGRIICGSQAVNVSFDPRQPEREWIRERAILISLLRQRQRVTLQSVRVGDEHA